MVKLSSVTRQRILLILAILAVPAVAWAEKTLTVNVNESVSVNGGSKRAAVHARADGIVLRHWIGCTAEFPNRTIDYHPQSVNGISRTADFSVVCSQELGYGTVTIHVALWERYNETENRMEGEVARWRGTFECERQPWEGPW